MDLVLALMDPSCSPCLATSPPTLPFIWGSGGTDGEDSEMKIAMMESRVVMSKTISDLILNGTIKVRPEVCNNWHADKNPAHQASQ